MCVMYVSACVRACVCGMSFVSNPNGMCVLAHNTHHVFVVCT